MDTAYFALGCFWGVEEFFSHTPGIISTTVGYMGGTTPDPNYSNLGDHAETTKIVFDPVVISFEELLTLFWAEHDPTFFYKGQYRSAIFADDASQLNLAKQSLKELQATLSKPIVTEIVLAQNFYPAEEHHQKYFAKHRA
jgi:peptide-methionine (S)-S-oxide reductase